MDLTRDLTEDIAPRLRWLYIGIAIFFFALLWQLVRLQLVDGRRYRLFAEHHSIKTTRLPAARGDIVDRHGVPLAQNRITYDAWAIPQELEDPARVATGVARLTGAPESAVRARLAEAFRAPAYQPVRIVDDLPYNAIANLRAWRTAFYEPTDAYDLRGVVILDRTTRHYADGTLAPHLLGYLREVGPEEVANSTRRAGDIVGASGLEARRDDRLRGRDGFLERLVDARGFEVDLPEMSRHLHREAAVSGAPLRLTIDARLQAAAARALAGRAGAVVALDPRTGAVLALASAPAFDLAALQGPERGTYWPAVAAHPDKPLWNRAIQSAYPPGSIYKIVTTAAGLGEGVIRPEEIIHCPGGMSMGGRVFGCWRRGGHGPVNLRRALAESCDVYFYTVGLRLGPDRLAAYARRFGLGHPLGIDLPHERAGLIPTTEWKRTARKAPWQAGDTLSIAIGQGYDSVTPLQAAAMVATVASGGRKVTPYLVGPVGFLGRMAAQRAAAREQVIPPSVLDPVRDGLEQVVAAPSGTAHALHALGLGIAGKTGTAQVVALLKGKGHGKLADHAWFVAYAPAKDPRIAVAVLVEHGGHGGGAAAPIAGEIIKTALAGKSD